MTTTTTDAIVAELLRRARFNLVNARWAREQGDRWLANELREHAAIHRGRAIAIRQGWFPVAGGDALRKIPWSTRPEVDNEMAQHGSATPLDYTGYSTFSDPQH